MALRWIGLRSGRARLRPRGAFGSGYFQPNVKLSFPLWRGAFGER